MMTSEQAKTFIESKPQLNFKNERFIGFSQEYQILGKLITQPLYTTGSGHIDIVKTYLDTFDGDITTNPWLNKEGKKLSQKLFGSLWAPYIADVWDLIFTLPYQQDYYRRSYRMPPNKQYTENAITRLRYICDGAQSGLHACSFIEVLRLLPHYSNFSLSYLLAMALKDPNEREQLRPVVSDIINGEDDHGMVSRDLIKALLLSKDKQDWALVGRLLLAAQRQEGLRQSILESTDETNLGALRYFINLILEHDLARFSSVIRAVDVWFGFGWEAPKKKTITKVLGLAKDFLEDQNKREAAFTSKDNLAAYIALWCMGVVDAQQANKQAVDLIQDDEIPKHTKLVALFFISSTGLNTSDLVPYMTSNWGKDIEQDYWLLENTGSFNWSTGFFEQVKTSADTLPKKGKRFGGDVFEWKVYDIGPDDFYYSLISQASDVEMQLLAKDIASIPSTSRERYMRKLFPKLYTYGLYEHQAVTKASQRLELAQNDWKRDVVYQAIKDRNISVMSTALNIFKRIEIFENELGLIIELLSRQAKDLRGELIALLMQQKASDLQMSTENLVNSRNINQRLAGLEILTRLDKQSLYPDFIAQKLGQFKARSSFSKNEEVLLAHFNTKTKTDLSVANGFGVIDYGKTRPLIQPQLSLTAKKGIFGFMQSTQKAYIKALVDEQKVTKQVNALYELYEKHRNHEYQTEGWRGETQTILLSTDCRYLVNDTSGMSSKEKYATFVLADVWEAWYRAADLNDYELFYAQAYVNTMSYQHSKLSKMTDFIASYYPNLGGIKLDDKHYYKSVTSKIHAILDAVLDAFCDQKVLSVFCLTVFEDMLARCPDELKNHNFSPANYFGEKTTWLTIIANTDFRKFLSDGVELFAHSPDMALKMYDLNFYMFAKYIGFSVEDSKLPKSQKITINSRHADTFMPTPILAVTLFNAKLIPAENIFLQAFYDRQLLFVLDGKQDLYRQSFKGLNLPTEQMKSLKHQLLSIELARGDLPTEATHYIRNLEHFSGYKYMLEALARLGKEPLDRGYSYSSDSKRVLFSWLIANSKPSGNDRFEDFSKSLDESGLSIARLVELACYAVVWADWIGRYLKIDNFSSAVWWFHAHASDYSNAQKETEIARYSVIATHDFKNGAIDIDWFNQAYKALGKATWKLLHDAAKYISDGNGHRQVKLYSSVMLGEVKITETTKKVLEKRDKDYLRALGLIPLSKTIPEKDMLKRYNLIQTFLKESKQFGAQRQESERIACEIALDNLARNAGYEDRTRFEWAMEGKATQDIMDKSKIEFDDVTFTLQIDEFGKADIVVQKGDKTQKSIPTKYKKDKQILSLKEGKTYLSKQYARTRLSLENAMLREDVFKRFEIDKIMQHPIVHAMLTKIVLFNQTQQTSGFYKDGALIDAAGNKRIIEEEDKLLIAHSAHLQALGLWSEYQQYIFENKISQVFKQVFRELYLITKDEKEHSNRSERYQGHQIQPAKTIALLRKRGWTVSYEEGLQKVYHKQGFMVTIYAMADWFSPADIEAPTLEYVSFHSLKDYQNIPLTKIPPVIFSEVMRDVDLVVSVAHVGQVDPEASHSSMEMRAALAKESARLFKLDNIEIKERHIIVQGKLAEYSIHLGSARVQRRGLDLNIIAIQSQHRGRVFLPFVDDDPKSAEIISKMKLLAEDHKIKDPTVLSQINK